MKRWIFVLPALAGIALALVCGALWRDASALKAVNIGLRKTIDELRARPVAAAPADPSAEFEAQRLELMRLRSEVTKLRGRTAELEARSTQANAAETGATGAPADGGRLVAKEDWRFAGYATPEAALLSGFSAIRDGQVEAVLDSLAPDARRIFEATQSKAEGEVAEKLQNEMSEVTGARVLARHEDGEEMLLDVYLQGAGKFRKYRMAQVRGGEWKFAGPIDARFNPLPPHPPASAMTHYMQNPELMKRYFPQMYEMMQRQQQAPGAAVDE